MGRRGPPPKPTKKKKLAGNPGKRRLPKNEPAPPPTEPSCPSWLSAEAQREWARITPILRGMALLFAADEVSLAAYCQAAAELQLATAVLEAEGRYLQHVLVDGHGKPTGVTRTQAHPALRGQRDAFGRVKAFLQEFGLSPSARARLGSAKAGDEEDDLGALILKMQGAA